VLVWLGVLASSALGAGFVPISVTGYTVDMIVEAAARPNALMGYTTASMQSGTNNTGMTWYELGYNSTALDTGLPPAGSTFVSPLAGDHSYRMAPSYASNNVMLLQTNALQGTYPMTLATPASYAALSFLCAASPGRVTVRVIHQHVGGDNGAFTFFVPDWSTNPPGAWNANGTVVLDNRTATNVYAGYPSLYSVDVTLSAASAITNLNVNWFSGPPGSHAAIFAVSGATTAGGPFNPIALTPNSYNRDIVIESNAPPLAGVGTYTTATMDDGAGNGHTTWYEQGFDIAAPATGIPLAGSTFTTNISGTSYQYRMAPDYTTNDAVLIDGASMHANFTLKFPTAYSALSFLCGSGNAQAGPVPVDCTVYHVDGTKDVGTIYADDWFGGTNAAWLANGRVSVPDLSVGAVGSTNPRLYARDLALGNTASPVTNVDFDLDPAYLQGHVGILAVSGILVGSPPPPPFRITAARSLSGTQFTLTWDSVANQNYQIQSKDALGPGPWTTNATLTAGGISASYTNSGLTGVAHRFYRVVATP
jgi:hypothetical protein